MKRLTILLTLIIFSGLSIQNFAQEAHEHGNEDDHGHEETHDDHDGDEHGHHDEGATQIDHDMAKQVSIVTQASGKQTIQQTVTSFGRLMLGPEQTGHVRARFPGVIKSVEVTIGDNVKTGDLLALVESNESLKNYEVRAPIDGTIIQRHANVGENTQEQLLFSISNFQSLWAELRIFPTQLQGVAVGQVVKVQTGDDEYPSTISHLIPAEGSALYVIARAKVEVVDRNLFPGLLVEGNIVTSEFAVALAVDNTALQTLGGKRGVFVKQVNEYSFAALVLGRSDKYFTEVLSGLDVGVEYVVENSYLIKADIEKSEAAHEH